MKSKKVTMLAAALVVAVVALAGVGYATQYTAKTTSTADVAESAYVKINQSGTGSYGGDWLTKVYFNTVNGNTANSYTYELNKEWVISGDTIVNTGDTAKTMALISTDLKLVIAGTNSTDSALNLTVTTENLTPVSGLAYRMILVDNVTTTTVSNVTSVATIGNIVANGNQTSTTSQAGVTTWQFTGLSASAGSISQLFVLLFIEESPQTDSTTNEPIPMADPGARAGFDASASFEFLVTADDA